MPTRFEVRVKTKASALGRYQSSAEFKRMTAFVTLEPFAHETKWILPDLTRLLKHPFILGPVYETNK